MRDNVAMLKCKHALDTKENEIGEELCFCEEHDCWRNITLGECFGNCEGEESDNKELINQTERGVKMEDITYRELLSCFDKTAKDVVMSTEDDIDETVKKMTREAIEKQVPKKPDLEGDGYDEDGNMIYDTWICPDCEAHYEVDYDDYNYCPICGQKLDMTDVN